MLGGKRVMTGWSGRRWGCTQDWLLSSSGFRLIREKRRGKKGQSRNTRIKLESVAASEREGAVRCWREDSLLCITPNRK